MIITFVILCRVTLTELTARTGSFATISGRKAQQEQPITVGVHPQDGRLTGNVICHNTANPTNRIEICEKKA